MPRGNNPDNSRSLGRRYWLRNRGFRSKPLGVRKWKVTESVSTPFPKREVPSLHDVKKLLRNVGWVADVKTVRGRP